MNRLTLLMSTFLLVCAAIAPAQTFTTLVDFDGTNGDYPGFGALTVGADGNLYGATHQGGKNNFGVFFKVTPAGQFTKIYDFATIALFVAGQPTSPLLQASDGNFYGTMKSGGDIDCGILYRLTPAGAFSVFYDFGTTNGAFDSYAACNPIGGVIQGPDGYLYGTASVGGNFNGYFGVGALYRISLTGDEAIFHSFGNEYSAVNGSQPVGKLTFGTDGNLYGIANSGPGDSGSIFRVATNGQNFSTIHAFQAFVDGQAFDAGLTLASDGNFYGVSGGGGANLNGVIYKATPSGAVTVLHTYSKNGAGTDGGDPEYVDLIQASDGNLYGTTNSGGTYGYGTVFQIATAGKLTVLHNFNVVDGQYPMGGLVQGSDGALYGTTSAGGTSFKGTVFKLTLAGVTPPPPGGTAPAVTSVVNDAGFKAGAPIASGSWAALFGTNLAPAGDSRQWNPVTEIVNGKLPTNLDGTSVMVNGKPAAIGYISPAQINFQGPDDTAVGPVQVIVTTKAGGASAPFTVNYAQFAPGLFPATSPYIAAQHADNTYVGGYAGSTPAKPGEVIVLWGSGFGPGNPAVFAGQTFTGASKLAYPVSVTIGGQPCTVDFAGIVGAGLVQINVHVPNSVNNGDAPVIVTVGGMSTQTTGNMIAIHN